MRETYVWRLVFWTLVAMAAVALIAAFDPGFIVYYTGDGVVALSTGSRIEVLTVRGSALTHNLETDLYYFEKDGTFKKAATFPDPFQCVTSYQGNLFVTFRANQDSPGGGPSSVYRDGIWQKSVSAPTDMEIVDVAVFRDTVYAVGLTADAEKIRLLALGPSGWQDGPTPFEVGPGLGIAGFQGFDEALEVVYFVGPPAASGIGDLSKLRWYHVSCDTVNWSASKAFDLLPDHVPTVSYAGRDLVLGLVPLARGEPVKVAALRAGVLETLAEVPTRDRGRVTSASLVEFDGKQHVFLAGPGHLWDVPVAGGVAGEAHSLLAVSQAALIRSNVYVALMLLCAVFIVSLGVTWLVIRIKHFGQRRKT